VDRALGAGLLSGLLAVCVTGCGGGTGRVAEPAASPPADPTVTLALVLPETKEAPQRDATLTIDGKDFTRPGERRRSVVLEPAAGKNSVTVVYSYWPQPWVNAIRTRVVAVEAGKKVEADLTTEDPAFPDKLKPVYFPTPHEVVEEMCRLGKVGKDDVVYDIGCGDGRLVVAAVKEFGARRGVGIDIDPDLVKLCRENARKAGVDDRVEFREEDALKIKSLADATVVLLYVGDELNLKLRPVLQSTLKPGSRVVSHRFTMGDWKPDETRRITATNDFDLDEDFELHLWTIK
jgi:SAM-dependent methyltransferase